MKRIAWIAAVSALALVAGCGETGMKYTPPETVEEEELPDAIPPSDSVGEEPRALTAPFNLPNYTPLRPDATIELSQATAPSGEPGGVVTFTTGQAPRAAGDFYKSRLQREFGAAADASNGAIRRLGAARGAERVEVSVSPAGAGARVSIAYVLPSEPVSETPIVGAGAEH